MDPTAMSSYEVMSSSPHHNTDLHRVSFTHSEDSDVFVADLATQITSLSDQPVSIQGHFCDLFTGLHPKEGMVALKRPRISISQRDQHSTIIRRFLREAKTWRNLKHPNVLPFLGACRIGESIYLVSPFMQNGTITDFINDHPQKANRIQLIREIASALGYLHAQNMIHGDLKGTNILVSDDVHALLCDFGLAYIEDADTSATMKNAGTIRWQAPETLNGAEKSFKSDVYSFAMTVVEILSGDVPFKQHPDNAAVVRAVAITNERPYMEPIASSEGISYEWIWRIAAMCWHKDPEERPCMSRVIWLLGCRAVSIPSTLMVPHANPPTLPSSMLLRYPTIYISPQDPFPRLSPDVLRNIFCSFSLQELAMGSRVCRLWNLRISTDPEIWAARLKDAGLWCGGVPEAAWTKRCSRLRTKRPCSTTNQILPHPYKTLFKLRLTTWCCPTSKNVKETRVHAGRKLVNLWPFLPFRPYILTVSDKQILLHSPSDLGKVHHLRGHTDDILTLDICSRRRRIPTPSTDADRVNGPHTQTHRHDLLISGSRDCSIRIWDLQTRKRTNTFKGHQGYVECLAVVRPVWTEADGGLGVKEKWPKHHMLVSGSADATIIVWRLPGPDSTKSRRGTFHKNFSKSPYYVRRFEGHTGRVSTVAVHGRTIASGSDDTTVRIWDLVAEKCKYTLVGHSDKVLSVALDPIRKRAFSGSLAGDIRIWSLENGSGLAVLVSPTSNLTGKLSLSTNALVAASEDGDLIAWDPNHILAPPRISHNINEDANPRTYHNDDTIILACKQELDIWNIGDGRLMRRLATNGSIEGCALNHQFCVATTYNPSTERGHLHIWDFAGGRRVNDETHDEDAGGPYDENGLAEEDVEFTDSEEEGEDGGEAGE